MDHIRAHFTNVETIQVALIATRTRRSVPLTKDDFYRFPEKMGWKLLDDYKLDISDAKSGETLSFAELLQAWLYFGLISAIVRTDKGPLLKYDDLCSGGFLNTKKLERAVEQWVEWETSTPAGRRTRLIQAEFVLTKARHVVRRNCSCELEEDSKPHRTVKRKTITRISLRAEEKNYSTARNDSRHLSDGMAFVLMTVGEYLWAAKSKISQKRLAEEGLTGWYGDDDAGWGPPRYVLGRMIQDKWCPRAVFLLKGLLRSSATLLLLAYSTYRNSQRMIKWHQDCGRDICRAKASDSQGNYANLCLPDCKHSATGCDMRGPKMEDVLQVLKTESPAGDVNFPLIRFTSDYYNDDEPVTFEVEAWNNLKGQNRRFATISHVWSDGWGNETTNELRTCQLRYIRRQLRRANDGEDIPFWMDTLIVPVRDEKKLGKMSHELRGLKTKAIQQIFELFAKSAFTVILDNGLMEMPPGDPDNPAEAAMKIVTSMWMRRLWTLHEAFLSKKRYVTFREEIYETSGHNNLTLLETLREQLESPEAQKSPVVSEIHKLLLQAIMAEESGIRDDIIQRKNLSHKRLATLVAGTWRAARWRTTSNAAHETLALATLLGVRYEDTEIEDAGLELNAPVDKMNRLVRDFWKSFHTTYNKCIPAGIIFLPGRRVQLGDALPGYGWAPRTWMSAHEVDFPDPLSRWTFETDLLDGSGLLVQYPGFIFSTDSLEARKQILGVDQAEVDGPAFAFPVDNSLLEWYSVRPAEPREKIEGIEGILNNGNQLAIILSRSQPKAAPAEIALLVEIYRRYDEVVQRDSDDASTLRYNCQIIRRVHVRRETGDEYLTGPGINGPQDKDGVRRAVKQWQIMGAVFDGLKEDICIGQALPTSQRWAVDGYIANRGKKVLEKAPTKPDIEPDRGTASPSVPPKPEPEPEVDFAPAVPRSKGTWTTSPLARAFSFGLLGRSNTASGGQLPAPGATVRSTPSPLAEFSERGQEEDEEEEDLDYPKPGIQKRPTLWENS